MAVLHPPDAARRADARRFVRELDRRLEAVDRAILVAEWELNAGISSAGAARWQRERSRMLGDERLLDWVRRARSHPWPPRFDRRLELIERIVLDAKVEQAPAVVELRSAMQRAIVRFRPRFRGHRVSRSVVWRASREDPRPEVRKEAYYAFEPLHRRLEKPLRRLVSLRNELARDQGYASFAHMRLGFEGFTPARLAELARDGARPAAASIRALRDAADPTAAGAGWFPWDLDHLRERAVPLPRAAFRKSEMVATVLRSLRAWGLPAHRGRFRVVFHDLPTGGLTLAPDPPSDVRVLVHPGGGWLAYMVLLHEFGHAIHSASIRAPRHLLRWHENIPGFGGFHEGIGEMFGSIASRAEWLETRPGMSRSVADAFAQASRRTDQLTFAWLVRWILVELSLYRDPARDPIGAVASVEQRLFGFDPYRPASFVDPFYIEAPVYAANYLLATLFQHHLASALEAEAPGPFWPNRRVGPWLQRVWFAPGSTFDWAPRLREVTGRPLDARAFAATAR
jgi:hypothetical protein